MNEADILQSVEAVLSKRNEVAQIAAPDEILNVLRCAARKDDGLTAREISEVLGKSYTGVRKHIGDLVKSGKIKTSSKCSVQLDTLGRRSYAPIYQIMEE